MKRAIKQYSTPLNDEDFKCFKETEAACRAFRNYCYSRYSGVNSITKLKKYRNDIRKDELRNSQAVNDSHLTSNMWAAVLDDAIGGIKSRWSNAKNCIRTRIKQNPNLSEDDRHYLYGVLKNDDTYHDVLNHYKHVQLPKKIEKLNVNRHRLDNLLRRYTRECLGKIPYSSKPISIQLDSNLYKYKRVNGDLYFCFSTLMKGKRIAVRVTDDQVHSGTLRVKLDEHTNRLIIMSSSDVTPYHEEPQDDGLVIGVDKGYNTLISTSTGVGYGPDFGEWLTQRDDEITSKGRKRGKLWSRYRELKKRGHDHKAKSLKNNNLGSVKQEARRRRDHAMTESFVNHELRLFYRLEKPGTVVCEDLTWSSDGKGRSKTWNRRLSGWCKRVIQSRMEFLAGVYGARVVMVNAAYTSQVCSVEGCGRFGERSGGNFTCPVHGWMDADLNAAVNVRSRYYDDGIKLWFSPWVVKKVLESRLSEL